MGVDCDDTVHTDINNNDCNTVKGGSDPGKDYLKKESDKISFDNLIEEMHKQIPNTCVTSSLEYISELLGDKINEGQFVLYELQNGNNVFKDGVNLSHLPDLIDHFYNSNPITDFKNSIDSGNVVMTDLFVDANNSHNVVVIGYQEDGDLIYMDPQHGSLKESPEENFNTNYMIEIESFK